MPKRTIADAFFHFKTTDGPFLTARRGETVDIPEGEDLDRGDKFGAFTAEVGQEPPPPEDTTVPDILVEWTPEEFNRFVDAATADEILAKLSEVAEEDQPRVAERLIEAENGHKSRKRKSLIARLDAVARGDSSPAPAIVDVSPLDTVLDGSVNDVLAYVGEHPDEIDAVIEAEESKDEPRRTLLTGL